MTWTPTQTPGQHIREHYGLLADLERRALVRIARRLPARINSDHLSTLALLSMLAAGVSFASFRVTPWAALGVIVSLFANWFGDSLDGTVARVRGQQRPRYGFYVDHVIDLAGTTGLLAGLACSGLMNPTLAVTLLAAYLLVASESYLATHAAGIFRMSFLGFGPTELRIVLAVGRIEGRLVSVGRRWTPGSPAVRCGRDCRDRGVGTCVLRERGFEHAWRYTRRSRARSRSMNRGPHEAPHLTVRHGRCDRVRAPARRAGAVDAGCRLAV